MLRMCYFVRIERPHIQGAMAMESTILPVGHYLAAFRGMIGATQSQLASAAGVDQSRVSRIENGEPATAGEAERLLRALRELGSDEAAEYETFVESEWVQVERPEFANPQRKTLEVAESQLREIDSFLSTEDRPWPLKRQLERQRDGIANAASYLLKTMHQIAFVGEVGVGKSTAISVLYELVDPTKAEGQLQDRVVLETGGGRTTLCEVNIRRGPAFGIVINPQSADDFRNLVSDFCAATWQNRAGAGGESNDPVNVGEEVRRALRNMSGLAIRRERDSQGKSTSRDLALELAETCESEVEFRARVIDGLRMELRTRRELWIEPRSAKSAYAQLRRLFSDVNNGRLADVPMPASIDLIVPDFGADLPGLVVSAVDTKGLDEIAIRADIDARLKDTRTHVVLCSTFNQAPSNSVRLVLDHLRNAHGLRVDTGKVSVLALPRDGEAMAVKDDSGAPPIDDEDGYALKRDQIQRSISGGDGSFAGVPIFFFNAKQDDPSTIRLRLSEQVRSLREYYESVLLDECAAASEVIHNHETQAFAAAVQEVADRLGHFLAANDSPPPRVRQSSVELVNAMRDIRYASTIWSMSRRNGEAYNFSVSHQIGAGAAKDALLRSKTWFVKLQGVLDSLKHDPGLALAAKTIEQVEKSAATWKRAFAEAARTASVEVYRGPLEADEDLWTRCTTQWGLGPGFKVRVENILSSC